jgi:hypothetical protein
MNEPRQSIDSEPRIWLDRLAADELSASARRELFAWLDREPSRWRSCTLALLETAELQRALGELTLEASAAVAQPHAPSRPTPFPGGDGRNGSSRKRWSRWLASVACLALAFASGAAVENRRIASDREIARTPKQQHAGEVSVADDSSERSQTGGSTEGAPGGEAQSSRGAPLVADARGPGDLREPIPPYVRSQLERQGYRIDSRHGVVSLSLPDGRSVKVPADRHQFRYVGRRSI